MTAYTTIPNGDIDQDSPVTVALMTAMRDNPLAIQEGDASAPKLFNAWVIEDGAGGTGPIYDHSVDGAVSAIETPNFTDGYDYRLLIDGLGQNFVASRNIDLSLFRETTASYAGATIHTVTSALNDYINGIIDIDFPRLTSRVHVATGHGNAVSSSSSTNVQVLVHLGVILTHPTAQKITKAKLSISSGNFDAGKVYLFKRGNFI